MKISLIFLAAVLGISSTLFADKLPGDLRGMYFMDLATSMSLIKDSPVYHPKHEEVMTKALAKRAEKRWVYIASEFIEFGYGTKSVKVNLLSLKREEDRIVLQTGESRKKVQLEIIDLGDGLLRFYSDKLKDHNYLAWKKESFSKKPGSPKNKNKKDLVRENPTYIGWAG